MIEERTGLLLLNLGTPESPSPSDVRRYLREFLSDPRVIDIAAWKRRLILELFILPFRPRRSGEAYEKIWTAEGSPLLIHGRSLAAKVQDRLGPGVRVDLAMRYGRPSIPSALDRLRRAGIQRIVLFPLYPQYSSATTGSTIERVLACASERWNVPYLQVVPPFYDHPAFIEALAEITRPYVRANGVQKVFFSFHGLPERQIRKGDDTDRHCLSEAGCCDAIVESNRNCYRAQCYATARLLADRLGLPSEKRIVCFQSRLGRDPWIRPYTDELIEEEAARGTRNAVILSPAFVADCLETLEELGIRAAESFAAGGGEKLTLVPCLNANDSWADAVVEIARGHSNWLSRSRGGPTSEPDRPDTEL